MNRHITLIAAALVGAAGLLSACGSSGPSLAENTKLCTAHANATIDQFIIAGNADSIDKSPYKPCVDLPAGQARAITDHLQAARQDDIRSSAIFHAMADH